MFLLEPGSSPPHGGDSGFVKTRGVLTLLVTGQGAAASDSLSTDPVSAWLQHLPTSWQMTVLSILGILFLILWLRLSVLYVWNLAAVHLYIRESRDMAEEGWAKIVRVMQGVQG